MLEHAIGKGRTVCLSVHLYVTFVIHARTVIDIEIHHVQEKK